MGKAKKTKKPYTNANRGRRIGGWGVFLMLGLFLPWTAVTCSGPDGEKMVLLQQNGIQAIQGEVELGAVMKKLQEEGKKNGAKSEEKQDTTGSAWWVALLFLGGLVGAGGGFMLAQRKDIGLFVAAGGTGLAVLAAVLSLTMSYPLEDTIKEDQEKKAEAEPGPKVDVEFEKRFGVFFALFIVLVQAGYTGAAFKHKDDPENAA